ncbi:hypothetical protein [Agrobacterium sp.]|nr:hypothetical protein [Agrobacterium sp.]
MRQHIFNLRDPMDFSEVYTSLRDFVPPL